MVVATCTQECAWLRHRGHKGVCVATTIQTGLVRMRPQSTGGAGGASSRGRQGLTSQRGPTPPGLRSERRGKAARHQRRGGGKQAERPGGEKPVVPAERSLRVSAARAASAPAGG